MCSDFVIVKKTPTGNLFSLFMSPRVINDWLFLKKYRTVILLSLSFNFLAGICFRFKIICVAKHDWQDNRESSLRQGQAVLLDTQWFVSDYCGPRLLESWNCFLSSTSSLKKSAFVTFYNLTVLNIICTEYSILEDMDQPLTLTEWISLVGISHLTQVLRSSSL